MAGQWQGYNMGSDGRASPAPMPARPARSVRRPARDSGGAVAGHEIGTGQPSQSSSRGAARPPASSNNDKNAQGGRAARLAQAIQREEREREAESNGFRPGSSLSFRSASPDPDEADFFGGEPLIVPVASTSKPKARQNSDHSPVLEKAIAAFSSAGQSSKNKAQAGKSSRDRAGTNASNASTSKDAASANNGRTRRGAVGVQGESARFRATMAPQQGLPSTPAFREMERVLAQVASEWPELLPPAPDDENGEPEEDDNFDPVTLALSLVNEEGSNRRLDSFLATKDALSQSLKSSIQTHYRAFDASASSYNGLILNLTHAQKNTTELRKVLEEVRETLGKRRTDLAVLEARRTELAEMDRILMTIETLRSIPDRLENLLSDKQFLPAASLLMRSLKMINRAEMLEVTATADLRSYFASQEALMLEYLTEELHSHLYLKSLYTESRWKAHIPQQTDLPTVYVEHTSRSIFDVDGTDLLVDSEASGNRRPTRLAAYLARLAQRPAFTRNIDEAIDENMMLDTIVANGSTTDQLNDATNSGSVTRSGSLASIHSVAGNAQNQSKGLKQNGTLDSADKKGSPEQDSFAYIESILESLAYLGKLGVAIDSVLQRNPLEIYNLVESTAAEVDERNDSVRRDNQRNGSFGQSSNFLLNGNYPSQSNTAYSLLVRSSMTSGSASLDDASNASNLKEMNTEILLDFFWTLFSKLDAVLQGFRVFHEVVQRIVKSNDFRDNALISKTGGLLFTLNDVWRPIQIEVQALLHDYLIDEHNANMSSRSTTASINDVLRLGRVVRDPHKALFKFGDSDSKAASRRIRLFEDSLNKALKSSVPGLVSSLAEGHSAGVGLSSHSAAFNPTFGLPNSEGGAANGGNNIVGRTHRMLVPPNSFKIETLALPALKFLERAKESVPEVDTASAAGLDPGSTDLARRCSGLMDEATIERLRPALNDQLQLTGTGYPSSSGAKVNGTSTIYNSNSNSNNPGETTGTMATTIATTLPSLS